MRKRIVSSLSRTGETGSLKRKILPSVLLTRLISNPIIREIEEIGWGTWIRTKINGVRVRRSTVELFPSRGGVAV